MNEQNPQHATKKVKYIVSIIYILVLAFIVGGSYYNQQQTSDKINADESVIGSEIN